MTVVAIDRGHALRALTHPVVPVALLIWLINDHVLKGHFGGLVTGKLTDVVAMVAFPLLVAAAAAPFSRRPLHVGVGFTVVFFTAINVSSTADRLTEQLMSLIMASRLTMDPTDLWTLPAVLGAVWVWNHAPTDLPHLRRSWGRALLAGGLAICVATSPDVATSEAFAGTAVLTADAPEFSYSMTVTIADEPAESEFLETRVRPELDIIVFGAGDGPFSARDAITSTVSSTAPGEATVTITLADPSFAPVEVGWTQEIEISGGGYLVFGGDLEAPVLTVDAPADEAGPEPFAHVSLQHRSEPQTPLAALTDLAHVYEVVITAPAAADLRLVVPSGFDPSAVAVATDDVLLPDAPGQAVAVPAPPSCSDPCTFSVWLGVQNRRLDQLNDPAVTLYDLGTDESFAEIVEHQLVAQQTEARVTTTFAEGDTYYFDLGVEHPSLTTPVAQATSFVHFDPYVVEDLPDASSVIGGGSDPRLITGCCDEVYAQLWLGTTTADGDDNEYPVQVTVAVTAQLLTIEPQPAGSLQVSVTLGE